MGASWSQGEVSVLREDPSWSQGEVPVHRQEPNEKVSQISCDTSTNTKAREEASERLSQSYETNTKAREDHSERVAQSYDTKMKARETATEVNQLPHNYEAILKDADSPIDNSSINKLYQQLHVGVFLNQKRKKYWVEKKTNSNCFMVFARDLLITWAENNRFWHWPYLQETPSNVLVDVAELLNVCWLEVHGKFEISKLTPGIMYEVAFVVMLKDPVYGWEVPVNLRLILPDGNKQEDIISLMGKTRGQWMEIPAGKFMTSLGKVGEMEFSLFEYESGKWKKGLVIKGVVIRPKN